MTSRDSANLSFSAHEEPMKSWEQTTVLDSSRDLRAGCDVRELDIDVDTIPADLLEMIEKFWR